MTSLIRRRGWPLWAVVTVVAAYLARADDPPDLLSFSERASSMLGGHLSKVYSGSWNQAGPVQLLAARLLLIGSSTDRPVLAVELVIDFALLLSLRMTCRRSGVTPGLEFVLTGLTVVWLGPAGLWSGHPVEVAIPLLWLFGAHFATTGRWLRCGCLLGLAPLVAPWAVLAWPVAFVARRGGVRAIGIAILVALAGYLPFVLSGHFGLFTNSWLVNPHTLVHLLAPDLVHFSWGMRLGQGAVAGIACFLVARWSRGDVDAVWAAPLMAVLLRILLDPVVLGYYWVPAGLLVIAGAAAQPGRSGRDLAILGALAYLAYFGAAGLAPVATGLTALAALLCLVVPRHRIQVAVDVEPPALNPGEVAALVK
jgi:hypothetical protein